MKKLLLSFCFLSFAFAATAQNGLEGVIVEKYYISDANDATQNGVGGVLPVGSVTYRVYADMLPGYKFQAGYGVPDHECRIETTTLFFNNEDRGATSPTYTKNQASNNTVMLDSWLSVGAACAGNFGILKTEDNADNTVVNADGVLQNNDPDAGIPISQEDGLIAGTPEQVTTVGISTEIAVFDNQNDGTNGPVFSTFNGSWASLNGSMGPDTVENKVLIAQITTDGVFSFALNIQIGTPSGGSENYVAVNPVGTEISIPSLIYNSLTNNVHAIDKSKETTLVVYPSPTNGKFSLSLKSVEKNALSSMRVFSMQGVLVAEKPLELVSENSIANVDISSLSQGVYFVEVLNGQSVYRQQIVKY